MNRRRAIACFNAKRSLKRKERKSWRSFWGKRFEICLSPQFFLIRPQRFLWRDCQISGCQTNMVSGNEGAVYSQKSPLNSLPVSCSDSGGRPNRPTTPQQHCPDSLSWTISSIGWGTVYPYRRLWQGTLHPDRTFSLYSPENQPDFAIGNTCAPYHRALRRVTFCGIADKPDGRANCRPVGKNWSKGGGLSRRQNHPMISKFSNEAPALTISVSPYKVLSIVFPQIIINQPRNEG